MKQNKILILIIFIVCLVNTSLLAAPVTLSLHQAELSEVLRLLAAERQKNIIISENVKGKVSIQLSQVTPQAALAAILRSAGLAQKQVGNIMLVAPQAELLQHEQQNQVLNENAGTYYLHFWHLRYAKAKDIFDMINVDTSGKSPHFDLKMDERTNTLYLYDVKEKINHLDEVIKQVDVPVRQILVQAHLVNIDESWERELGIQFGQHEGRQEAADQTTLTSFNPGSYTFAIARLANGASLEVKLAMLERSGHAELISSPSLYAANRQSASIEAGEEVPYQETSDNGGTAVVFKKAVLALHVVPQVLPDHQVLLQLRINQDRPGNQFILGMPTISTRQILTNVLVHSGETIVLGGIQEKDMEKGVQRLPWVSQIPILGMLFKETSRLEKRRHLLIFVTPTIVA